MQFFNNLRKGADFILRWMAAALLGSMAAVIFLQVIYRYIFESPFAWSEELARFLFVWVTFIGGTLVAMRGGHIGVSLFVDLLPGRARRAAEALAHFLTAAFFAIVAVQLLTMMDKLMGQVSPAMRLPMGYPYLGMLIGSAAMSVIYAGSMIQALSGIHHSDQAGENIE